jgi:NAD-dependent dihydropyrimidine dehydrogenase PreA subunit
MDVYVEKQKCTGCEHCKDVCPVAVFEMMDINSDVNKDSAPPEWQWKGEHDPAVYGKWKDVTDGHNHFKEKSVAVNGPSCILCQACLIECEGECIVITDDNNTVYRSVYK